MTKLYIIQLILFSLLSFFLGYSVKSKKIKKNKNTVLNKPCLANTEEKKLKDILEIINNRLSLLEHKENKLKVNINEIKTMQQKKEQFFITKINDIEKKVNTSIDDNGRIPQLEEVALSIDKKLNDTVYDAEGLKKVRKIKKLEVKIENIKKDADCAVIDIDKEIKILNKSINSY